MGGSERKNIIIALFVFLTACVGAEYTANESGEDFDPRISDDLPVVLIS